MFSYLILLHDPKPHPMLAVEEPENHLYPRLLSELAEEFRDYARRGGQVFVSTHSPEFINGASLEEIYWLEKKNGFATVQRAADRDLLRRLIDEGDRPGELWRQGLFEGADPITKASRTWRRASPASLREADHDPPAEDDDLRHLSAAD